MRKVVYLQVYKGKEILLTQNGKVTNQNQVVTLEYPTSEWDNYMKHLSKSGFCKVEVKKVLNQIVKDGKYTYTECEDFKDLEKIVKDSFEFKIKEVLTPEQKEIKELRKKLDSILNVDDEREKLVKLYIEKYHKKPNHLIKVDKLKELIAK